MPLPGETGVPEATASRPRGLGPKPRMPALGLYTKCLTSLGLPGSIHQWGEHLLGHRVPMERTQRGCSGSHLAQDHPASQASREGSWVQRLPPGRTASPSPAAGSTAIAQDHDHSPPAPPRPQAGGIWNRAGGTVLASPKEVGDRGLGGHEGCSPDMRLQLGVVG